MGKNRREISTTKETEKEMKRTKKKKKHLGIILTNDPSITAWGWAVLTASGKVVDVGCIKTSPGGAMLRIRKGDDRVRRVSEIVYSLLMIIDKYNITFMLSELPHGSQSAVAATMIGMVTGIMQTIADVKEIPVEWFSEGDAKMSVSGKRSVGKDEMVKIISKLYDVEWTGTKWRDQGIADALAVHYVATQQSNTLKMMK